VTEMCLPKRGKSKGEVEECIPQTAYFETLVTNGKRTSENPQKANFALHDFCELRL
jgi:hypothetical protein